MRVASSRTQRDLRVLGEHVAAMRKIQGLTAQILADRAGITRTTLRNIERGEGSPRVEAVLAVLRVLGLSTQVVAAADPFTTEIGRLHAGRAARQRVRTP